MLLSEDFDKPGLIYFLPKTIVTLEIAAYGSLSVKDGAGDPDTGLPTDPNDLLENIRVLRFQTDATKQLDPTKRTGARTVADVSRGYTLRYDARITSLDRVCMGVSDKGLLTTVEGAADDKTADIIVSVAKLAGRVLGPGAFASVADIKSGDDDTTPLRSISIEIDPLNRVHWQQVNRAMRAAFGPIADNYRFRVEGIESFVSDASAPDSCPVNSVCYRTSSPLRFTLSTSKGPTSTMYQPVTNRRVTGRVDVSRALMVEKITRLTFDKGVLTGVTIRKPSEGLAVAKLPLTVLDAAVTSALAAPGNFANKVVSAGISSSDLIAQSEANASQIAALQKSLANIRNQDLSDSTAPGTQDSGPLQLQCKGAFDIIKPAPQ